MMPHIVSALTGIAVWVGIGILTGNPEAWDSSLYWKGGIPFLALVTFIIGFLEPKTPYLWGVIQALSQSVVIFLQGLFFGYSMNLYPPSILVSIILATPSIITAFGGVALRKSIQGKWG